MAGEKSNKNSFKSLEPPKNPWVEKAREEIRIKRNKYLHETERPDRRKAWKAVKKAVKNKEIIKPQYCQLELKDICSGTELEYAGDKKPLLHFHHTHGYSHIYRLTGIWICEKCHQHLHREMKSREAMLNHSKEAEKFAESPGVVVLD